MTVRSIFREAFAALNFTGSVIMRVSLNEIVPMNRSCAGLAFAAGANAVFEITGPLQCACSSSLIEIDASISAPNVWEVQSAHRVNAAMTLLEHQARHSPVKSANIRQYRWCADARSSGKTDPRRACPDHG